MAARASILPDDHAQFTSRDYWDKFFKQRGQLAFEWYGDFNEVFPLLSSSISKSDRILIIGCGNSNFSSDLYDKGYRNITNLDFSALVIDEMRNKNVQREHMQWVVGDMTLLHEQFANASFDVVIDKGALDALMSDDTAELRDKAVSMFESISAVLTEVGKYFLISLGEDFVFATVRDYFLRGTTCRQSQGEATRWQTVVSKVQAAKPSPFIPLLFTISKMPSAAENPQTVTMTFTALHTAIKPSKSKAAAERYQLPIEELAGFVKHFQDFNQLRYRLSKLEVGRFESVPLWSAENSDVPRFTLYIVDANEQASLSMAVFFIPFGREADYQFTTLDGLADIAFQAQCKRLIAVACNRPHVFGEMSVLQDELSPVVMSMRLAQMDLAEKIPYMAIAQDKSWEEISTGRSPLSGYFVVEEKEVGEDEEGIPSNAVYRRLIFLQNQQFVQTEVRLVPAKKSSGSSSSKKKSNGGKKKSSSAVNKDSESNAMVFDHKYLDEHHRALLSSMAINNALVSAASVRHSASSSTSSAQKKALLVGLGGGALTMALQRLLPGLRITACELDSAVVDVARSHFGFESSPLTEVVIEDGIKLMHSLASQSQQHDVIIIDVDSKDPSLGLSAPPRDFVTYEALEQMHSLLAPGGLLLLNVVARSKSMYGDLVSRIKGVFHANAPAASAMQLLSSSATSDAVPRGRVLELKPGDENVNVCLVCVKAGESSSPQLPVGKGKKASGEEPRDKALWGRALDHWLSNCSNGEDSLDLESFLAKLHDV